MMKRLFIAALLALNLFAVASTTATADSPWPVCFPCPDEVR